MLRPGLRGPSGSAKTSGVPYLPKDREESVCMSCPYEDETEGEDLSSERESLDGTPVYPVPRGNPSVLEHF